MCCGIGSMAEYETGGGRYEKQTIFHPSLCNSSNTTVAVVIRSRRAECIERASGTVPDLGSMFRLSQLACHSIGRRYFDRLCVALDHDGQLQPRSVLASRRPA